MGPVLKGIAHDEQLLGCDVQAHAPRGMSGGVNQLYVAVIQRVIHLHGATIEQRQEGLSGPGKDRVVKRTGDPVLAI